MKKYYSPEALKFADEVFETETVDLTVSQRMAAMYVDDEQWRFANDPHLKSVFRVEMLAKLFSLVQDVANYEYDIVEYPETWWDAVKERWFPAWAKKRWPVNWNTVRAHELYPNIKIPKYRKYCSVHLTKEPRPMKPKDVRA